MSELAFTENERIVAEAFGHARAPAEGTPQETPPEPQEAAVDPQSPVEDQASTQRERDEQGRFRRSEQQAEAPDADDVGDDLGEDLRAVWERYGGDQRKLLQALIEKESMIGRQATEMGELRSLVERVDQRIQSWEDEPEPVGPAPIDQSQFQALLDQSPRQALAFAINQGHGPDTPLYDYALQAWADSGDPKDAFEAAQTDSRIRMTLLQEQHRLELQQLYAPIQQQMQQQQVASTWNEAFVSVANRTPDINELLPVIGEIAQSSATFKRALMEAPSVQEKARIIEEMVYVARGRAIPSIKSAAAEARQQAEDEGRVQRQQAFVASGSSMNREQQVSRADKHAATILAVAQGLLSPGTREAA